MKISPFILGVVSLAITLVFSLACGSSNSGSSSSVNAPEDSSTFTDVQFEFNPKILFTSSSAFSYENLEADTEFPSGNSTGTYTYTQISTSQSNLIFTFTDNTTLPLTFTGFTGSTSSISSFSVAASSGNSYDATVTAGTLVPEVTITTTSTTSGTSSSTTLPDGLAGQSFDLTYDSIATVSGFSLVDGDVARFVFSSSGTLFYAFPTTQSPQTELGSATLSGSEYVWTDSAGVEFAVSLNSSGNLHEINVSQNSTFAGQFSE